MDKNKKLRKLSKSERKKRRKDKKLSRSKRKAKPSKPRKVKPFTVSEDGLISEIRVRSPEDALAWEMAFAMTQMNRPSRETVNRKAYCKKCMSTYCLGFDNIDVHCKDCYYFPCKKEFFANRKCKRCGG